MGGYRKLRMGCEEQITPLLIGSLISACGSGMAMKCRCYDILLDFIFKRFPTQLAPSPTKINWIKQFWELLVEFVQQLLAIIKNKLSDW